MTIREARYRIVQNGNGWSINHDGQQEGDYATKEAAFEAIVGAASNSIKDGCGVTIEVPGRKSDESALGAQ
jgi:hypothetical protein